MADPSYFDFTTFATVTGAVVVVVVVSNTLRRVTRVGSPLIPFLASLAVGYFGAHVTGHLTGLGDYALAFFNSCLLFCTATGAQETVVEGNKGRLLGPEEKQSLMRPKLPWLSSWIRD
jgi:hypothetical protein